MADKEGVRDLSEDFGNLSVKDGPCVGVTVDGSGGDQNMTVGAMAPVTASKRSHITTEEEGISDIAAAAGRAVESGSSEVGDTETPAGVSPPVIGCPVGHVACGSVECGDMALGRVSELQETCSDGQGDGEVGHSAAREREGRQDWHEAVTDGKPATGSDVSFGHVTTVTTTCQAESDCAPNGGCNAVGSEAGGSAGAGRQPQSSQDFCCAEEEDDPTNDRKLFVGNIGYKQNWRELKDFFSQFGKVVYAQIVIDHLRRRSRGIGFVEFATIDEALRCYKAAVESGLIFKGRKLRVDYATESRRHRSGAFTKRPTVACTTPDYEPAEGEEDKSGLLTVDEWAMIFSYLTISEQILLERVCKGWRDMALLVWKRRTSLSLERFCNALSNDFFKSDKTLTSVLSRCGPFLYALDLGRSQSSLTDYCVTIIEHYCPQLRKLNLEAVYFKTTGIKNLSKVATDLTWINLQRCSVKEKGDSLQNSVLSDASHRPQLPKLAGGYRRLGTQTPSRGVAPAPHRGPTAAPRLPPSHRNFCSNRLWWLLKNCQKLEHVDITRSYFITGKCFHMVGPRLRSLHANGCIQLTDYCVESLVQKCPNIQELRLGYCSGLTGASLVALAKLTSLEVLDFSRNLLPSFCSDVLWTHLGNIHNLRQLKLNYIEQISDDVLKAVTQGCPKLQILNLRGCCSRVTSRGLRFLLGLKELSTLDVSYILAVNDTFLGRLSAPGRLRDLTIRVCPNISRIGVLRVLELSPGLRRLDLCGNVLLPVLDVLTPLTTPIRMIDHPPHHSLDIYVGGTAVAELPEFQELFTATKLQLPPHVTVRMFNASDIVERDDSMLLLEPSGYYDSDDEEDEYAEFYRAQANNQPLQPAGNIGQMEDDVGEAGEEGAYGPPVPEDCANNDWAVEDVWGAEVNNDCPVEEDLGAEVNNDRPVEEDLGAEVNNDRPVEEDWGAEVNPPGPSVPVQVMADNLRAYDDFFDDDEDYDEFLVNDDPLEMERWDLS